MTQYDAFEQKLADSLQSNEMPSEDFAARVMAQVAKTPQVKAGSSQRTRKIVLTAAACLAVVCLAAPVVFLGTMRMGSSAPQAADCAAESEAPAAPAEVGGAAMEPAAEAACEEEAAVEDAVNSFSVMASEQKAKSSTENGAMTQKNDMDGADSSADCEEVSLSNTELCRKAREVLGEMGLVSDSGTYALTAEQGAALQEVMPELKLPAGAFTLVLEG